MRNSSKMILDGKKGKLSFKGSCLDILDLCKAMCCRQGNISITKEEFASGLYETKLLCLLNHKVCENEKISCLYRRYQLKGKKDSSCIYLNSKNKCSIYENRPGVCRRFTCKGGWKISSAFPLAKWKNKVNRYFIKNLQDDMKFIQNPLIKLKAIFHNKRAKEIVFVKKLITKCSLDAEKSMLYHPEIKHNNIFYLINLCNGKNTLRKIYDIINKKNNLDLSKIDFYKIIWLLNEQRIYCSAARILNCFYPHQESASDLRFPP